MPKWKKILLIAGFAIIFIVGAILIYVTFFKPFIAPPLPPVNVAPINAPTLPSAAKIAPRVTIPPEAAVPPATPAPTAPPAVLPKDVSTSAKGGLTQVTTLTDIRVYGATLDSDGKKLLYYDKDLGKFYRLFPDGRASLLSKRTFFNVKNITWNNNKEKTILEYPDGSNIIYNFKTNKQITLPKHWEDFNFSPLGGQIAAKSIGVDAENRWLVLANDDGSNARAIQELADEADRVIVDWSPSGQMVAMYADASGEDRQKLYFIGQNKENFRLLVLPGFGFEEQWSPSGEQMLFSIYNKASNYKPELWLTDIGPDTTGTNRKSLKINTWASKCIFADENITYCAVPRSLKTGFGLYPKEAKAKTVDDFYKINLKTGIKTLIARPYGKDYAVENLMLSKDKKYLYFTDYASGRINKLQLAE